MLLIVPPPPFEHIERSTTLFSSSVFKTHVSLKRYLDKERTISLSTHPVSKPEIT
jgi:hypothetical protein